MIGCKVLTLLTGSYLIIPEEATQLAAWRHSGRTNRKTGLLLKLELSSHEVSSVSMATLSSLQVQNVPAAGSATNLSNAFTQVRGGELWSLGFGDPRPVRILCVL